MIATALLGGTAVLISMGVAQKREQNNRLNHIGNCEAIISSLTSWVKSRDSSRGNQVKQYSYQASEKHRFGIPLPKNARFSKIKDYPRFQLIGEDPFDFHFETEGDRTLADMTSFEALEQVMMIPKHVRTWQFLDNSMTHYTYYYNHPQQDFCSQKVPVVSEINSFDPFWEEYRDFLKKISPPGLEDLVLFTQIKRRTSENKINCDKRSSFEAVPLNGQSLVALDSLKLSSSFRKFGAEKVFKPDPSMLEVSYELKYRLKNKDYSCMAKTRFSNEIDTIVPQPSPYGDCDFGSANMCVRTKSGFYKGNKFLNLCGDLDNRPTLEVEMKTKEPGTSYFCRIKYVGKSGNKSFFGNDTGLFYCDLPPKEFLHGLDPLLLAKASIENVIADSSTLLVHGHVLPGKMGINSHSVNDCPEGNCPSHLKLVFDNLSEGEYMFETFMVDPSRNISPIRRFEWSVELLDPSCKTFDKRNDCKLYHPVTWIDGDHTCSEVPIDPEQKVRTTRVKHGTSFLGLNEYCPSGGDCQGKYRVSCLNGTLKVVEKQCSISGE